MQEEPLLPPRKMSQFYNVMSDKGVFVSSVITTQPNAETQESCWFAASAACLCINTPIYRTP